MADNDDHNHSIDNGHESVPTPEPDDGGSAGASVSSSLSSVPPSLNNDNDISDENGVTDGDDGNPDATREIELIIRVCIICNAIIFLKNFLNKKINFQIQENNFSSVAFFRFTFENKDI